MSERKLDKYEVAAMWLFHDDYALAGIGAVAFWATLPDARKRNVVQMVDEILAAPFGTWSGARRNKVTL